jgi:hypothetical protein
MEMKILITLAVLALSGPVAFGQRGGGYPTKGEMLGNKAERYSMLVDSLEGALGVMPGNFRATKTHIKIVQKWIPKLVDKLVNHRNKHEIQGSLNVVNIHHKLVLASLFREAKNKNITDIKQAIHRLESAMTNIRLGIVENYGLHIAM